MYKIYIRPLAPEDAKISYKWRNDPEVWKFTGSRPDREITYDIESEWIHKAIADPTCKRFAIMVDEKYVGNIQLTNIEDDTAEFHIFIGDRFWWGKGVGRAATEHLLTFARQELKLKKIYLTVRKENIAAIKSYRKVPFEELETNHDYMRMVCNLDNL